MLVLSRKDREKLQFPGLGITLEVMRIQGRRVQLGITAPRDVVVLRDELADLKSLEFPCDDLQLSQRLSCIANSVGTRLTAASSGLNELHQLMEDKPEATRVISQIYQQLFALQEDVDRELVDLPTEDRLNGLLINRDPTERDLLASCFRLSGLEVHVAQSIDEALDFLSLHHLPDFALVDQWGEQLVARLQTQRSETSCVSEAIRKKEDLEVSTRLYTLGIQRSGVDRCFDRPVVAERMIESIRHDLENLAVAV